MTSPSRRIALFGLFGVGNIGNEASLASAIRAIRVRDADAEIVVVCAEPSVVTAEHGVEAVLISMPGPASRVAGLPRLVRVALRPIVELARCVAAFRFLLGVERIVVPGTGILDDFGMSPQQMPWDLVRWSAAARVARRPFCMLSIGAGPILHPVSRRFAVWTVTNSAVCTYRDEVSRTFMNGLGCPSDDDAVQPDLVFALARPDDGHGTAGGRSIGVGVMAYYGWSNSPETGEGTLEGYLDAVTAIVVRFLDAGDEVRVLVGERTDELAVNGLRARLAVERPSAADRVATPTIESVPALLEEIARTDGVVATRYHNLVGAMMMHRPVVALAYADKHDQLLDTVGVPGGRHRIDAIDPGRVVADLEAQLADPVPTVTALAAWDEAQRAMVEHQYDRIFGP